MVGEKSLIRIIGNLKLECIFVKKENQFYVDQIVQDYEDVDI